MRWTLIVVLAFVSAAAAQQPSTRTPPAPGVDIFAKDGDRITVEDDARIHVVRRRQATLRTIYSQKERLLIVLLDYSKPGAFPMARSIGRTTSTRSKAPGRLDRVGKR